MQLVNYLAELWGILLVIFSFGLILREKHLKRLYESVESEQGLLMWGLVSLVIGVAMVLSYNVWDLSWHVIITILGWVALLKGLAILFITDTVKFFTKRMENWKFVPYALVVALVLGLVITYFGFTM